MRSLFTKTKKSEYINIYGGQRLQILVENNGRISASLLNRTYGIIGDAFLNDEVLNNFNVTSFPFDRTQDDPRLIKLLNAAPVVRQDPSVLSRMLYRSTTSFSSEPIIFKGTFFVSEIGDTFVDPRGWGKVEYSFGVFAVLLI